MFGAYISNFSNYFSHVDFCFSGNWHETLLIDKKHCRTENQKFELSDNYKSPVR